MSGMADIESARRGAGVSLQYFWEATEHDTLDDLEDEHGVREAYAGPVRWLGRLHFFGRTEHDD